MSPHFSLRRTFFPPPINETVKLGLGEFVLHPGHTLHSGKKIFFNEESDTFFMLLT